MSWIRGVVIATVLPLASNVAHMVACIEVFADVTCPFTHVGLKQVVRHVAEMREPVDVVVRAWPLEWVNGVPLDVDPVIVKAQERDSPSCLQAMDGLCRS